MIQISRVLTINIGVHAIDQAASALGCVGLAPLAALSFAEPPAQVNEVTFPFLVGGALSLVEPSSADSPVARVLDRRGPGPLSVGVEVDDLCAAMRDWHRVRGEWVLDKPAGYVHAGGKAAERVLINWLPLMKLGCLLVLEVCKLEEKLGDHDA